MHRQSPGRAGAAPCADPPAPPPGRSRRAVVLGLLAAAGLMVLAVPALAQMTVPSALAVRLLDSAIQTARDTARAAGTRPIPPAMRARLAVSFPEALLERVRWRLLADPRQQALAGLPPGFVPFGDLGAVALIDTIVFTRPIDAQTNELLWAHELGHVQQYDRWGVAGFARRYVADRAAVEAEADAIADRHLAARGLVRRSRVGAAQTGHRWPPPPPRRPRPTVPRPAITR